MRIYIISFTSAGAALAGRVMQKLPSRYEKVCFIKRKDALPMEGIEVKNLREWTKRAFEEADGILFIGACGIAVRSIAPFVEDKWKDPAVLVMDEQGLHCISLLSGHVGGGNEMCRDISRGVGAEAVITTATDVNRRFAVDVFAQKNGLLLRDRSLAKEISAQILQGKEIPMYIEAGIFSEKLREALKNRLGEVMLSQGIRVILLDSNQDTVCLAEKDMEKIGIYIGITPCGLSGEKILHLLPKRYTLGIGCKKGTDISKIEALTERLLQAQKIPMDAVSAAGSIDLKKEEQGLQEFCSLKGIEFLTFSKEELNGVPGNFTGSDFVKKITGTDNVCERSAVKTAEKYGSNPRLYVKKNCGDGVTAAVAVYDRDDFWAV